MSVPVSGHPGRRLHNNGFEPGKGKQFTTCWSDKYKKTAYSDSSSQHINQCLPLQVFREFAQPDPLASDGSTTVYILLFFDLARLIISIEKLVNNPLMTQQLAYACRNAQLVSMRVSS